MVASKWSLGMLRAVVVISIVFGLAAPAHLSVLADDGSPQVPTMEETNSSTPEPNPETPPPAQETPAPDQSSTPPPLQENGIDPTTDPLRLVDTPTPDPTRIEEPDTQTLLQQIPQGAGLVVLDQNDNPISLAGTQAAETIIEGDPWFCPAGVAWNKDHIGCTTHGNLTSALNEIAKYGSGTIYIEPATFGVVEYDFDDSLWADPTKAGISVNIIGGFDLVNGVLRTYDPSVFTQFILRNFKSTGNLVISNIKINNIDDDEVALSIENSKNVTLKDIIVNEQKNGHGLQVKYSQGAIKLENITVTESGNGDGVRIIGGSDVVIENLVITESDKGHGVNINNTNNLIIRNSNILEKGEGSALLINNTDSPIVRNSVFKSLTDNDPVIDIEDGKNPTLEDLTITFEQPKYISSARNTAIVFYNVRGDVEFNRNTLYLTQPSTPKNENYFDGVSIYKNMIDENQSTYTIQFNGIGNILDGGNIGSGSNAVFVDGTLSAGSVNFNWNKLCNWSQGYFKNSSSLLVNGINNIYCPNPPTDTGDKPNIRGSVTYLPVASDEDVDDDGLNNWEDTCPTDANPGIQQIADKDFDKIPDACDHQDNGDTDEDGVQNWEDTCPLVKNSGDAQKTDTDKDGIPDACDSTPNGDADNDGVDDKTDTCPGVYNPGAGQTDNQDGDAYPDACDPDDDNDGIDDVVDNCPLVSTSDRTDTDGDGKGDACDPDDDDDGVTDGQDNCPLLSNTDQTDTNKNNKGDVCDPDDDGDGVPDDSDNCRLITNPDQANLDGDTSGDACDSEDNRDNDGDSVENWNDSCVDHPNGGTEQTLDSDKDHTPNACDPTPNGDSDKDGIDNLVDNCPNLGNSLQEDSDGDGKGDVCDPKEPQGNNPKPVPSTGGGAIPVTGAAQNDQSCLASSILKLKDGSQISLDQIPCGYQSNAFSIDISRLPAQIPAGRNFFAALTYTIGQSDVLQLDLPGQASSIISFKVPDSTTGWYAYYWNPNLNNGMGGWEMVDGELVNGNYILAVNYTGTFILVN